MIIYYTKKGNGVVKSTKSIQWGLLHREDGPAIIWPGGSENWYLDGKKHRLGGPAISWYSGEKEWWVNGKRHRLDGPAIIWKTGDKEWFVNGKKHRLDGPAIESYDKMFIDYFINDKKLNKKEVEAWVNNNNINLKIKQHQALFMLRFG